jgi:hypothetical protein
MVTAVFTPIVRSNEIIIAGLQRPVLKFKLGDTVDFVLGRNATTKIDDPSIAPGVASLLWSSFKASGTTKTLWVKSASYNVAAGSLVNPYSASSKKTPYYLNGSTLTGPYELSTGDRIALGTNFNKTDFTYEYKVTIVDNENEACEAGDGEVSANAAASMNPAASALASTERAATEWAEADAAFRAAYTASPETRRKRGLSTATANMNHHPGVAALAYSASSTGVAAVQEALRLSNTTLPPVRRKRSLSTDAATAVATATAATEVAPAQELPRPAFVDDLHCPLCLEIQVQAITLVPCGHSLCLSCWNEAVAAASRTTCCQCDQAVTAHVMAHAMNNVIAGLVATSPALFSHDNVEEYHERLLSIDIENKQNNLNNKNRNGNNNNNSSNPYHKLSRSSRKTSARKAAGGVHRHRHPMPASLAARLADPYSLSLSSGSVSASLSSTADATTYAALSAANQRRQHRKRMLQVFEPADPPEQGEQQNSTAGTPGVGNSLEDAICID